MNDHDEVKALRAKLAATIEALMKVSEADLSSTSPTYWAALAMRQKEIAIEALREVQR